MKGSELKKLSFLDRGVAQIAFVVEDLEKTVENYYKSFGIGPWHFYTYEKPLIKTMSINGKPADYRMRIALSYFGSTRIELIQDLDGDTVYRDFISKHGYGVQHLGFLVDDMATAIKEAEEAGLRMTMDGTGFGLDGDGHYAYFETDEELGTTIELIQRPRAKHPPEKIYPEL
ncbi:MAG: VOC family protein [Spirochaetales bacterium]|nr:VOC family protein [Spirochaetales bacterium]